MSSPAKVTNLVERIPAELRPHLAPLLRQLAHDLKTPLSTFTMEIFSARLLLNKLRGPAGDNTRAESRSALSGLDEVHANLELAVAAMSAYAAALSGLAAGDSRD